MKTVQFPPVIQSAIDALDPSTGPYLTSEITKLYGQKTPNHALIADQVNNYYLPMYSYLKLLLETKRSLSKGTEPLMIGISAPQGCGKTTMTDMIKAMFHKEGKKCVSISLDDFYLTGAEQDALAKQSSPNKLLQLRGNAGSHDLDLLNATMESLYLQKMNPLPFYDKSLRAGKGDRAPVEEWQVVNDDSPVDIVLFEGWMLGFHPVSASAVSGDIATVNKFLSLPGYAKLHSLFDGWLVIALEDINFVYEWRLDAEKRVHILQFSPRIYSYIPLYILIYPCISLSIFRFLSVLFTF